MSSCKKPSRSTYGQSFIPEPNQFFWELVEKQKSLQWSMYLWKEIGHTDKSLEKPKHIF
jgi:hypothetical protein